MKKLLYTILVSSIALIYVSCNKEDYAINRISSPENLSVSRGDTSVFLKWNKVEGAAFYTVVRGLKVIADSLQVESYEDSSGPDTLTEYRVYSVDALGWRSSTYASDSGYIGIPDGIIPRVPEQFEASINDFRGCVLSWTTGRFATSYKIYKNGTFYADVTGNQFIDYDASYEPTEYTIYSSNYNGESIDGFSVTGYKSYVCFDNFERYDDGFVITPWTSVADRTMYYTEGITEVREGQPYSGKKSLRINNGKIQILHDWGGAKYEGYYIISFMAKKVTGTFYVASTFAETDMYQNVTEWTRYTYKTGLLEVGNTFNLTIDSKGTDENDLYVDDISISYMFEDK